MDVPDIRLLILLGGLYHDFDGFARAMTSLFETKGWSVETTYDLDVLTRLDRVNYQVVLSYTCLSKNGPEQEKATPERLTEEQVSGLVAWVQNGGALLTAHCGTVVGESDPDLGRLLGGRFISHPAPFNFTVYPLFGEHRITEGIPAFDVHDEFYIEHCEPNVDIHMIAVHEDVAHPMVWSKREGAGRVAHIAPGHFPEVWNLSPYRRLMIQSVNWLTEDR
ncbi:MAG TPA: ThuA domain-containing protein [Anaerolineales bacterium]|nr:ThuA domain-containing protein [Anaerolineales bacterium]